MLTMFALLSYFSANTYKKGGVVNAIELSTQHPETS